MAKDDKKNQATAAQNEGSAAPDLANFLPKGVSEADLKTTGGLAPLATAELLKAHPVSGYMLTVADMPERKNVTREDDKDWRCIVVEALYPCRGERRNADGSTEIVDVAPGETIMVPVSGNVQNNQEALRAAMSKEQVFWALVRCTGTMKIAGKPSPMNVIEIQMDKTGRSTRARQGSYKLYNQPEQLGDAVARPQLGTARPELYDPNRPAEAHPAARA